MTKTSLNDWSTTPALNTDIAGTDIDVGCAPQDVGVFMRTIMAQIAYAVQGSGGTIPAEWHVDRLIFGGSQLRVGNGTTGTDGIINVTFTTPFPLSCDGVVVTPLAGVGLTECALRNTASAQIFISDPVSGLGVQRNFSYIAFGQ